MVEGQAGWRRGASCGERRRGGRRAQVRRPSETGKTLCLYPENATMGFENNAPAAGWAREVGAAAPAGLAEVPRSPKGSNRFPALGRRGAEGCAG